MELEATLKPKEPADLILEGHANCATSIKPTMEHPAREVIDQVAMEKEFERIMKNQVQTWPRVFLLGISEMQKRVLIKGFHVA